MKQINNYILEKLYINKDYHAPVISEIHVDDIVLHMIISVIKSDNSMVVTFETEIMKEIKDGEIIFKGPFYNSTKFTKKIFLNSNGFYEYIDKDNSYAEYYNIFMSTKDGYEFLNDLGDKLSNDFYEKYFDKKDFSKFDKITKVIWNWSDNSKEHCLNKLKDSLDEKNR